MRQVAPDPQPLFELMDKLTYKSNWQFDLLDKDRGQGSEGLTLCIRIVTPDSYHPDRLRSVIHYMPVPPAAYDKRSWQRWLFDQILLVETHEACESFRFEYDTPNQIGTELLGTNHHIERPYAPSHGPGSDPYLIRELGTDLDARTSFRGEVNR